ncbi:hypothetical protein [Microbulbifer magnicolonia]|uniref:hypothetical protein n=1 Tax=Microbulbifer magnicolonia TaxID=3109744 RepID=UPI002B40D6A5|nr:hypothetical protein [Microbulbifer sp. GG15]
MKGRALIALVPAVILGGCAGFDGFWDDLRGTQQAYTHRTVPVEEKPAFPRHCIEADTPMAGLGQCMEQGVHCYQLDNGDWCAGPYSPFALHPGYEFQAADWSK